MSEEKEIHYGINLGNALAVVISWSVNKSILWGLVHGLFGWFYVIYYFLGGGR
jgi:hypothetical protein